MLVGQGYVGKTILAMSLGVSVAAGKPIWRSFEPSKRGRVLHLDYEQGRRVTSMRLQRLARSLGVTEAELADRWGCAVLPRVNLASAGARDIYARLFEGWDLVILDALKGMTPGVEENSSAIRDYMHVLTEASEKTGAVPLIIHHAGKTPMAGSRPRKEMARGSSGIFDECQSVFVLTGEKGTPISVSHEKDRERGETVADFALSIQDEMIDGNPKGGLVVVQELGTGAPRAGTDIEMVKTTVLAMLAAQPDGYSEAALAEHLKKRVGVIKVALEGLTNDGRVLHNGAKSRGARWLASRK
jgi:hypothetical protein